MKMQDGYLLFVRDPRTRAYTTDGAVYVTEIDALLALGTRTGYARPRHAWTREFTLPCAARAERR